MLPLKKHTKKKALLLIEYGSDVDNSPQIDWFAETHGFGAEFPSALC